MIKFWATKQVGNRTIPVIGLSRANCELLLEGRPIVVVGDEIVPDLEIGSGSV
jgi:hypothetical protein